MNYHGSKGWLRDRILALVPESATLVVSPFVGSGKLEYHLAKSRPHVAVQASDLWGPLVAWHEAMRDDWPELSAALRSRSWTLTKQEYKRALASLADLDRVEGAAAFWVVMKNSFNGIFGLHFAREFKRTDLCIKRLASQAGLQNFTVSQKDALEAISAAPPEAFLLCDPPYCNTKPQYSVKGAESPEFHENLAEALRACGRPFVLFLNDCEKARELYGDWCEISTASRRENKLMKKGDRRELIIARRFRTPPPAAAPHTVQLAAAQPTHSDPKIKPPVVAF